MNPDERSNKENADRARREQQRPPAAPAPAHNEEEEEEEDEEATGEAEARRVLFQNLMRTMMFRPGDTASSCAALVQRLKDSGVLKSEAIERAFLAIPKIHFVTKDLEEEAYHDTPLRVGTMGFNISAPHMYAICLEKLGLEPGMSFLDIGSGCGLLTALGAYLVGPTGVAHGLEIRQDIIDFAMANLKRLKDKCQIELPCLKFFLRNCFVDDPEEMKYDRIHVGACCPESLLKNLFALLNPRGKLVTPYGDKLICATKDLNGKMTIETISEVRYGDLIVPSQAEMAAGKLAVESRRAEKIVVPPNNIIHELGLLVNCQELSDVTFIVENQKVFAHKLLLQFRSQHFRAMFATGMKEATMAEIVIPNCPHAVFLQIMRFIYTGETVFVNEHNAVELLEWANYFKCDRLKAQCEDLIRTGVDVENAASLITIADRFDARQLRGFLMEFVFRNFQAVSKTKAFRELDPELMMSIMNTAVTRLSKAGGS